MRKIFFLAIFTALLSSSFAKNSDFHESPETLCARFVDCMKSADFDNIMELYAYNNDAIVKNIDPKSFLKRLNALTPNSTENLPADYYRIKQIRLCAYFAWQLNTFCSTILLPEDFDDYLMQRTIPLGDNDKLTDLYLQSLDTERLKKLELVRMDLFDADLQKSERHQNNISKLKKVYKFDNKIEYTVQYKLDDAYYEGGITFSKFGDKWYIDSLSSSLANLQSLKKIERKK